MDALAPAIAMIVLIVTLGSVLGGWLRGRRDARLMELRMQLHNRVLDRFESAADAREYLSSQSLGELVGSLDYSRPSPAAKLLASVQIGIVAAFTGVGLLVLRGAVTAERELQEGMLFLGGLSLFVGLGFVVSALVGRYLAGRWDLLESPSQRGIRRGEAPGETA
jgi:hypothetical protein